MFRYKKLWARHQKSLRGLPNWKMALALKDSQLLGLGRIRSGSSGSSSRSISESFSPPIIQEEDEDEALAEAEF